MRGLLMKLLVAFIFSAFVVVTSAGNSRTLRAEAAVRKADIEWAKAVASKSVEPTVAFYAPDAVTAGSAMFPASGIAELRAAWADAFAEPGFNLKWKVEKVVVAKNGNIAYSSGTWDDGKQHGPYLAVWQKQPDGQWKLIIDSAWIMP